jgi:hypothetical protein
MRTGRPTHPQREIEKLPHVTCGKVVENRVFGRCLWHPFHPALPYVSPLLQYFGTAIAFPHPTAFANCLSLQKRTFNLFSLFSTLPSLYTPSSFADEIYMRDLDACSTGERFGRGTLLGNPCSTPDPALYPTNPKGKQEECRSLPASITDRIQGLRIRF